MNVAEMIPPVILDMKEEQQIIDRAFLAADAYAEKLLKETTFTWKAENRPVWKVKLERFGSAKRLTRSTESTPFVYVNEGTKPYTIPKAGIKPGGLGPFRIGFVPLSTPGSLASTGIGKAFGSWVRPKKVKHPGIKARNFTGQVAKLAGEKFWELLQKWL